MTTSLEPRVEHYGSTPDRPTPTPSPTPRRTRSAFHYVAIVIGCLTLLPSFAMMAGGGAMLVGQAVATDDDGYFRFTLDRLESDGVAIATTDLWLDDVEGDASPWLLDWLDVDLRLRVDGAAATDEVFVGIARSDDVERYLADVGFSRIVEVDGTTTRYDEVVGRAEVDPPNDQEFWAVSASGPDEQEVQWDARGGRWSVVVMNADGAADVSADVEVGARSGAVTPIAIALLIVGGLGVAVAITLIVIGARGRRNPGPPVDDRSPVVDRSSFDDRSQGGAERSSQAVAAGDPLPPPTPPNPAGHDTTS